MLLEQLILIGIIILVGVIVLSLRRKANASRTGYKLILLLLGLLLGMATLSNSPLFRFDAYFLKSFFVFLLIVLMFELSVRLNSDNITLSFESVTMFFSILALNILVLGVLTTFLINVPFMQGVAFAILLSSIEYFLVDQLRSEGDFANPLIVFFAFSILVFYSLQGNVFENIFYFLKYIIIGLGVGVLIGIIVFRYLRNQVITPVNELGLVAVAVLTYVVTEQLAGSGLFAVMILGTFFGNSYVRKTTSMYKFSPFIFKTLEMLIFLMIGFVAIITFKNGLWWQALIIYGAYLLLRLLVLRLFYKHYSLDNLLLLTLAPKGMILGASILVLGIYGSVQNNLLTVMTFVLLYSLVVGIFVEYIEQQKTLRLDETLKTAMTIRLGKKRNILRRKKHHK
jgi:NhaP-type Na+/H+ and K+/H+ antiporter